MPMTPSQRARWTQTRAGGRAGFLVKAGLLGFGIPMSAVMLLMSLAMNGWVVTPARVVSAITAGVVGGLVFGLVVWTLMERRFTAAEPTPEE